MPSSRAGNSRRRHEELPFTVANRYMANAEIHRRDDTLSSDALIVNQGIGLLSSPFLKLARWTMSIEPPVSLIRQRQRESQEPG